MQDLIALFLAHRSSEREETTWLAYAIAAGCMGGNHLWQDMGLTDRQALSELLSRNFTTLHDKNSGNMKWKKFFYKQLCDRAEVNLCKAPSCQVCSDYRSCFGPEDASGPAALSGDSGRTASETRPA
jgi:nitrogen fixation protein NifQ